MLETARWTLRQPRYRALAVGMAIVAALCVVAGTWQISRFEQSVRDNDALDGNAHAAVAPLSPTLVPLVGQGPAPSRDAIRFRTVSTTGSYLADAQQLVRDASQNGVTGYYVLTPLRDAHAVLLVVRGFVADNGAGAPPVAIAAPPEGPVQITGRLQTASTNKDDTGNIGNVGAAQVESINATEQAARLNAPVYQTYLTLNSAQPGTSGLSVLADPDLSNPAGGAYEAQHFAYILQWYLFALLALAAPFIIGRFEVRDARRRFLGIDSGEEELGADTDSVTGELGPAAQLTGEVADAASDLAVRSTGEIARRVEVTDQEWQTAARLADRYGRSLGIRPTKPLRRPASATSAGEAVAGRDRIVNSAMGVHRSEDAYHGAYNDYLWQIAMADAAVPTVGAPPSAVARPPELKGLDEPTESAARAIEARKRAAEQAPIIIEGSAAETGTIPAADDENAADATAP